MTRFLKNIFFFFAVCSLYHFASAREITVGEGGEVKTIKLALALAKNGDKIILGPGIYKEGNIIINKSISLEGRGNPVIDGEWKNEILTVTANNVTVKNITFKNVAPDHLKDHAAIRIAKSKGCSIIGNTVVDAYFGIYLENSDSCKIIDNRVKGRAERETTSGNAIHLWYSKATEIRGNFVSGHRDGIYLEFVEDSNIIDNESQGNLRYGLHFMFSNRNTYTDNKFIKNGAGVAVMYSKYIKMTGNEFKDNQGPAAYGILLKDITDSHIERNEFNENTIGILAEGSNRVEILNNNFRKNGWAFKIMGSCESLKLTGNNFIGNSFELATSSRNVSGHSISENFWSSYSGYDLNGDGIGDVPHRPVSLFSYMVEKVPATVVLIRSMFVDLLELAEKVTPSLTPASLVDEAPKMKINQW